MVSPSRTATMAESSGVGVAARVATRLGNAIWLQALLGKNAERLQMLRRFAVDRGPELMGDLFCPWAKWIVILLNALVNSDDEDVKLFIARIFGMQSPHGPIKSPLHILISSLHAASEEVLQDAKIMTDVRAAALAVCRVMILMLIMVIGDFGWKWLIGFHLGLFVAQTNLQFDKEAHHLIFLQAVHLFLYILDAVVFTRMPFFCRFLLYMVSSVSAIRFRLGHDPAMIFCLHISSISVMFFCTPLWFSVCLLFAIPACEFASRRNSDDIIPCTLFFGACLCVVRVVLYASGGGFCGALFVFLCPMVPMIAYERNDTTLRVDLVTPLPLVCALLSCFYMPFWVGLCFTSMVICSVAAANDNVKAILWWFVSFAVIHLLSFAFTRSFSVVAMCFLGSYFSYGCIL